MPPGAHHQHEGGIILYMGGFSSISMTYPHNAREATLLAIAKIEALLSGVRRPDIEQMPPAQRQHLAQVLRHIADLADPPKRREQPKTGVLADLHDGRRAD
jgi:hypothetical protein